MAELTLQREYRLKFYLNARHYIIINGEKGEVHPHTWEFALRIKFGQEGFVVFSTFEKGIEEYLSKYQNQVMNDIDPFDSIMPTLENMADFFSKEFYDVIRKIGGQLVMVEASETPTRSYVLNLEADVESKNIGNVNQEERVGRIIDSVINDALETQLKI